MRKFVKERPLRWIAIWIALGAGIGVPLDNIPLGVGVGTAVGFIFFLVNNIRNKKKAS